MPFGNRLASTWGDLGLISFQFVTRHVIHLDGVVVIVRLLVPQQAKAANYGLAPRSGAMHGTQRAHRQLLLKPYYVVMTCRSIQFFIVMKGKACINLGVRERELVPSQRSLPVAVLTIKPGDRQRKSRKRRSSCLLLDQGGIFQAGGKLSWTMKYKYLDKSFAP